MSILKIALLGPPQIAHQNKQLTFPDRKALALLAYLAAEGGIQERQKLTRFLWPESDMAHGRTALRITLFHLRRLLQEPTSAEPALSAPGDHLLVTHDAIGLNLNSAIEIDVKLLESAWKLAREFAARKVVQGEARRLAISRLQPVVSLYRGEFLQDFTLRDTVDFDNWVSLQQGYWYQRIEQVLDWQSQWQEAEGMLDQAIETVERWRALDPLNEDIYLRLMQLQFAAGNRIGALKTYETCVEVLKRELSTKPSLKLAALAKVLRNPATPKRKNKDTTTGVKTPLEPPLLEVPLVGRGAAFSNLMNLYEKAMEGQPKVVVIEGEAGIGKSRLAAAFIGWARAQGAAILEGKAYKAYQHLPYQPLLESLRNMVEQEANLPHLISNTWLAELSRLLPELRERYPDLPPATADETFGSVRFFEAVARLGQAFAEQGPLLIFIDDLQWADKVTLDLFHYLATQWTRRSTPVMILLNRRVETRSTDQPLDEWFNNLQRAVSLTRLELGLLKIEDLLQIVQALDGAGQPDSVESLGAWLYTETKGQPFFLKATLATLLERGALVPRLDEGKGWVFKLDSQVLNSVKLPSHLPGDVRTLIQHRLAQLSPATRLLLTAGAVLEHNFTFEALYRVAQLTIPEALMALDEAVDSRLIQEVTSDSGTAAAGSYIFAHDKIREVVYNEAGEARRRIFHARALEVLAGAGATPAELAYHALAAGVADEAFRWSVVAGDEAFEVFALRDAIEHYEQARWLLDKANLKVPAASLQNLFSKLGRAYEIRNDARAAQATYRAMLEIARRIDNPKMECLALNRQAVLEGENLANLETALKLLGEARQLAERSGDQTCLAETYWSLARVNYYCLRLEASLVYGRQAYSLAQELDEPELFVRVLNILSYTNKALGRWEEAAFLAEKGRQLAVKQGNRILEADCLSRVADARINFGQSAQGVAAARAAYAISLEIEHSWSQALSGYILTRGLVEIGSYEEALNIALKSTTEARTLTFSILLIMNLAALGQVYLALQSPGKAVELHLEALKVAEILSTRRYISMISSLLCAGLVLGGKWKEAADYASKALATRDIDGITFAEIPRWPETAALLYAGDTRRAGEDLQIFYERFGNNPRCLINYLRAKAQLLKSNGENVQAIPLLRQVLWLANNLKLPGELWQTALELGELLTSPQENEEAAQVFAEAAAAINQLAERISDEELRGNFLQAPPVQTVFHHLLSFKVKFPG